jgi:hypothetical protein
MDTPHPEIIEKLIEFTLKKFNLQTFSLQKENFSSSTLSNYKFIKRTLIKGFIFHVKNIKTKEGRKKAEEEKKYCR